MPPMFEVCRVDCWLVGGIGVITAQKRSNWVTTASLVRDQDEICSEHNKYASKSNQTRVIVLYLWGQAKQ